MYRAASEGSGAIRGLFADNLDYAKSMLSGNPVFEACGTIEIRELPRTSHLKIDAFPAPQKPTKIVGSRPQ